MTEDNQTETLRFLADHQLPYVCVDMPQGYPSSIPPVLAATSDLSEDELDEWARRIRGLAAGADTIHVVFNNCYSDYAHVNAQQLEARLGPSGERRPWSRVRSGSE